MTALVSVRPPLLAYGDTQRGALARVQALALRVIAERLEHGEAELLMEMTPVGLASESSAT